MFKECLGIGFCKSFCIRGYEFGVVLLIIEC